MAGLREWQKYDRKMDQMLPKSEMMKRKPVQKVEIFKNLRSKLKSINISEKKQKNHNVSNKQ